MANLSLNNMETLSTSLIHLRFGVTNIYSAHFDARLPQEVLFRSFGDHSLDGTGTAVWSLSPDKDVKFRYVWAALFLYFWRLSYQTIKSCRSHSTT
ncbi:hypothetical protein Dsin_026549 [Dipteronia sinensis]|uniref:Uncharacterized protein n=1 Tax=Dipteronia sinensis TaxID=43782 RepID=A0AAD9ZYW2_9ROSI|nr:hypothetical protein Dsin_026549 [Dipteronia sinensis]